YVIEKKNADAAAKNHEVSLPLSLWLEAARVFEFRPLGSVSVSLQCCKQRLGIRVITEGFADMREHVAISGCKNEAGAELEGIFADAVLPKASGLGTLPGLRVVAPQQVKQIGGFQFRGLVSLALRVHQQRKRNTCFFAERVREVHVSQPDRR